MYMAKTVKKEKKTQGNLTMRNKIACSLDAEYNISPWQQRDSGSIIKSKH